MYNDLHSLPRLLRKVARDKRPLSLASAVALVAGHTVVDVATNVRVMEIGRVPAAVAAGALEDRVVARIGVASRAHPIGVAMVHVEPGVIKGCAQPTGRRVADSARRRKPRRDVIRIVSTLVVGFVATVAISGQRGVVVVYVTVRARHSRMRPRQWERRVVVIEGGRHPCCCAMANVALLREAQGDMVGIVRALKILHVAADTSRIGDAVIPAHVTLTALDCDMRSS